MSKFIGNDPIAFTINSVLLLSNVHALYATNRWLQFEAMYDLKVADILHFE